MSVSMCENDKQLEQTNQLTNGQTILGGNKEEKDEKERETKLNFLKLSGSNKRLFIVLALSVFSCGSGYSLLAPFYPLEAEKKGVSQTIIGLVFSVFSIVSFCASPVIGGMLTILGAKFVCVAGLGLAGCSSLLFGVLDKCPSGTPFIVLSFVVRVVEALGALGVVISSTSIASCQFPDNVSTVVAILAAFYCIGLMIGPTIGGLLYEVGGFGLPFWAVGAAILIAGVIIFITLPPQHEVKVEEHGSMFVLLRSSLVWLGAVTVMGSSIGFTFIDPVLTKHVQQFGVSPLISSLLFAVVPGIYALTSPFWGWVSDRCFQQRSVLLLIIGNFLNAVAYLLIGPTNLGHFLPNELWLVVTGLVLYGLVVSVAYVPAIKCSIQGARELGFPESLSTYGYVNGLQQTSFHLGGFIGPTIGGALADSVGFNTGSTIVAGIFLLMSIICTTQATVRYILQHRKSLKINHEDTANQTSLTSLPPEKLEKTRLLGYY